jgi:hypothetical protein
VLSVLDGPHPTCVGHDEGRSRSWCLYFLHGLLEGGFLSRSWPWDVSPISGSLGRKRKVPRKSINFPQIVPEMLYRIQESVSSCSFLLPWSPLATFKKTWTMVSKGITKKEKTFELCPSRKNPSQGWIMVWGTLTSQIHVYYINIPRHGQKTKQIVLNYPSA